MARSRSRRGGRVNATGRNECDPFVMLPHWLLDSPAFRSLSSDAVKLLLHVWRRHNGSNNGSISYAVREAGDKKTGIGLSKDRASRAFDQLTKMGFLKVRRASTFDLKTKEARTWELTAVAVGDERPTKDFMRWTPPEQSHQCDRDAVAKNKTRSHQHDAQSHQRDSKPTGETMLQVSVSPVRPSTAETPPTQSRQCDTYNIPSRLQPDERTDQPSTTPTEPELQPPAEGRDETHAAVPPAPHQRRGAELPRPKPPVPLRPVALPIGPATAAAMQAKVGREQQPVVVQVPPAPVSAITHDPRQLDLVTFVEQQTGKPTSAVAPVDQLRADLARHLDSAPRGEVKRIAAVLGLSGPQISNFKAGRFNLNSTAEAVLRQYLNEARQRGAAA